MVEMNQTEHKHKSFQNDEILNLLFYFGGCDSCIQVLELQSGQMYCIT